MKSKFHKLFLRSLIVLMAAIPAQSFSTGLPLVCRDRGFPNFQIRFSTPEAGNEAEFKFIENGMPHNDVRCGIGYPADVSNAAPIFYDISGCTNSKLSVVINFQHQKFVSASWNPAGTPNGQRPLDCEEKSFETEYPSCGLVLDDNFPLQFRTEILSDLKTLHG